jgi:hypothetical protein
MGQVSPPVKAGIDSFSPLGQLKQDRLVLPIPLIAAESGDSLSHCVGSIGCAALSDLGIEGCEIVLL